MVVRVDAPAFHGYGELMYIVRPETRYLLVDGELVPTVERLCDVRAAVLLENGNTWFYDLNTVEPADPQGIAWWERKKDHSCVRLGRLRG